LTASTPEEQRIALFIDFENIAIGVRDAHYRRFDINLVIERLVEKGKILAKRAYADWGRYGEYRRSFHEAAVELIEVPQKSVGGKNSADIRLVVDAMDMSFQKEHIDCFCIASGDSDFSPLVSKLKENDKYVIGLGVKNSTSDLLMENCDEFIFYEDLVRRQEKPAVVIPNIPDKLQEAFSILVDSVVALQLENKGALWGSVVKETMKRKKPSFNETYYGFRSFSSLLEDAQRRGVVTMRRDQKSGSYIVEDLGPAARGDGAIVAPRPAETEAVVASANNGSAPTPPPAPPTPPAPPAAPANTSAAAPAPPAPTAAPVPSSASSAASIASAPAPSAPAAGEEEVEAEGAEAEGAPRPRRRRGGRGRGRGRDGRRAPGDRESQPDLEAVADEPSAAPISEDSNPSIPPPPQAAAAYAEVVERMSATDAPVFVETAPAEEVAPARVRAPRERHHRERKPEAAVTAPAPSPVTAADAVPTPATPAGVDRYGRPRPQPEPRTVVEPAAVAPEAAPAPPVEPSAPTMSSTPLEAEAPVKPTAAPADETSAVAPPSAVASPAAPAGPKPTPPVTPVDPTKASFSLLGWLKGGG